MIEGLGWQRKMERVERVVREGTVTSTDCGSSKADP